MTRRFEPYGYMSSNLRGIFLSQQNAPGLLVGGRVSTSPSEVERAPRGVRPVSAAAMETGALQGEWHISRTMQALP